MAQCNGGRHSLFIENPKPNHVNLVECHLCPFTFAADLTPLTDELAAAVTDCLVSCGLVQRQDLEARVLGEPINDDWRG